MRNPSEVGLSDEEGRLYDLIWKRTMASQMADAKVQQTSIQLRYDDVTAQASGRAAVCRLHESLQRCW